MKSIRFKLWAGMMALILIVLILLWLFQIVFLGSFYTNMHISEVKSQAASILNQEEKISQEEYENKLEALAYANNMSIEILDGQGNTRYTTGTTGMGRQMPIKNNNARINAYNTALMGEEFASRVNHPRFGNQFIMLGLPIIRAGEITGAMLLTMPLAPVEETVSILKWQLFYITLILLVASLLISFLISKSFTRPILEIEKASEKMASGDYSARIQNFQQDELGRLAKTINHLGQQLSKIEQLRKDLIANVSHELRTPLSLIRGYAETLRDVTGNDPEKREKQLGIIIEETERLNTIVEDILNLSQLQSGYIKLQKGTFGVKETLEAVIKRYDVLSEKTGVKIIQEVSEDGFFEGDVGRIEQVLYNLINNAFNHTPSGGTITIRTRGISEGMRFEISDTGNGIRGEDIPHIWDRYYKGEKTSSKKSIGTGLGLAIVKGVLEAHQAAFGVESKEKEGTTFWFELKNHE